MKRVICLLFVVLMITACGPTLLKSRTADITLNKQNYSISVQAMDTPPLICEVTLFVNKQEVAKGLTSVDKQTTISGKYQGIKFDAECGRVIIPDMHNAVQRCLIYANGDKVAELPYSYSE